MELIKVYKIFLTFNKSAKSEIGTGGENIGTGVNVIFWYFVHTVDAIKMLPLA